MLDGKPSRTPPDMTPTLPFECSVIEQADDGREGGTKLLAAVPELETEAEELLRMCACRGAGVGEKLKEPDSEEMDEFLE